MNRRTALKRAGSTLVACTVALPTLPLARARAATPNDIPLKLSPGEARALLSFDTPGEYLQQRRFLVDGIYPAGTTETGRTVIRPGDYPDTLLFDYAGELVTGNGEPIKRHCKINAFLDLDGNFIYQLNSSYGSHRRTFTTAINDTTRETVGNGMSGVSGKFADLKVTFEKDGTGYRYTEWMREDGSPEWVPIVENSRSKTA